MLTIVPSKNLTILPKLSLDLESDVKKDGAELHSVALIRFYGEYLRQQTNGKPSRTDYSTIGSAIVNAHPELAGGHDNFSVSVFIYFMIKFLNDLIKIFIFSQGIVRTSLSVFMRNKTQYKKKCEKKIENSGKKMRNNSKSQLLQNENTVEYVVFCFISIEKSLIIKLKYFIFSEMAEVK